MELAIYILIGVVALLVVVRLVLRHFFPPET
jgi:hypothetical protein